MLTAEEFFSLYSGRDGKAELVRGKVVMPETVSENYRVEMAPVGEEHGVVAINVGTALKNYSRQRGIGRVGVEIGYILHRGPDTVRAPDVSFYLVPQTEGEARRSGFVPGVPDIAVEVALLSSTPTQLEQKIGEYLAAARRGSGWSISLAGE